LKIDSRATSSYAHHNRLSAANMAEDALNTAKPISKLRDTYKL